MWEIPTEEVRIILESGRGGGAGNHWRMELGYQEGAVFLILVLGDRRQVENNA